MAIKNQTRTVVGEVPYSVRATLLEATEEWNTRLGAVLDEGYTLQDITSVVVESSRCIIHTAVFNRVVDDEDIVAYRFDK